MQKKPYTTPYCLHCYAPLDEVEGASTHCPHCDKPSLTVDLARLWTRERKIREIEDMLKGLILIVLGGISAYALLHADNGGMSGKGHGMAAGAPILLGILLWDAASITRKTSTFRGSLIWPIVGGIFIVPSTALFLGVPEPGMRLIAGAVVLSCVAGLLSPLIRRRWLAWRENRIATKQHGISAPPEDRVPAPF